MYQTACGAAAAAATGGSCVEPERDQGLASREPATIIPSTELDCSDFDIVKATQVSTIINSSNKLTTLL